MQHITALFVVDFFHQVVGAIAVVRELEKPNNTLFGVYFVPAVFAFYHFGIPFVDSYLVSLAATQKTMGHTVKGAVIYSMCTRNSIVIFLSWDCIMGHTQRDASVAGDAIHLQLK